MVHDEKPLLGVGVNNELKSVEASSALPKRDCRLDGKAI